MRTVSNGAPAAGGTAARAGDPRAWRWAGAAVLAALAARLALAPRVAVLQPDGCYYLWIAEDLARGEWARALADPKPPLYPALAAAVHLVSGAPLEAAARAVSVALGALAAAPLFLLFRRASGSLAAAAAGALLYAVQPESVRAGADVMSEATFAFFVAAALAAGLRSLSERSIAAAAVAGATSGLAYLVRPEGLVVALVLGAVLAFRAARERSPARAGALAALLLGTAVAAGPYAAWLSRASDGFEITGKHGIARIAGWDAPAAEAEAPPRDDVRAMAPGADLGHEAAPSALRSAARALRLFADALHPALAALALIGAASARARSREARVLLLAIVAFVALAALVHFRLGYLSRRHLAAPAALATFLAGCGAAAIVHRWDRVSVQASWGEGPGAPAPGEGQSPSPRGVRRPGFAWPPRGARSPPERIRGRKTDVAAAALAAVLAAILLPKALSARFEHRAGLRDAGAWLRAHGGEGAKAVGLFGTEIAYLGGAREIPMPRGSAAEVVAFARARGARFIAISLRAREGASPADGERSPAAAPERAFAAAGLEPAYRAEDAAGGRRYLRLIYDLGPAETAPDRQ